MARKRYTAEEIIGQFRTIEIELGKGLAVVEAGRTLEITEPTDYRWKKAYGGLRVDQAKRLKGLEQENARLKRLVADLSLDNSILKEVAAGNFYARPDTETRCAMHRRRSRAPNAGRVEWWGNAGPLSNMCRPTPRARTGCRHGSSRWPMSMVVTGTGGSPPCDSKRGGG